MIQQFHCWVSFSKKMKTIIQKDVCTPLFLEALSIIAMIVNQPTCPSTDKWIKKMWYAYIYIYIYVYI